MTLTQICRDEPAAMSSSYATTTINLVIDAVDFVCRDLGLDVRRYLRLPLVNVTPCADTLAYLARWIEDNDAALI